MNLQDFLNADIRRSNQGTTKKITLTDDVKKYTMLPSDQLLVVVSSATADADGIIVLPSMAEAAGKFYYIGCPTSNTKQVNVYGKESGAALTTVGNIKKLDGYLFLFCDGYGWRTIISSVS